MNKFFGAIRTFNGSLVTFVSHMVVEETPFKPGTTLVLTPNHLKLTVPSMLQINVHASNSYSADHNCSRRHSQIFLHCSSEKIRLDISCESSAGQRIHIKH